MPYKLEKVRGKNCWRVSNLDTGKIHSYCTTKEKAQSQLRLLHGVDHGWIPGNLSPKTSMRREVFSPKMSPKRSPVKRRSISRTRSVKMSPKRSPKKSSKKSSKKSFYKVRKLPNQEKYKITNLKTGKEIYVYTLSATNKYR